MCEFTCSNCGLKAEGLAGYGSGTAIPYWHRPAGWTSERWLTRLSRPNGVCVVACSRECMEALEEKTDLELMAL